MSGPAGRRPTALVVQHGADVPPGLLGDWLERRGFETVVWRPIEDASEPEVAALDLAVSLGSVHGVNDGLEWVDREIGVLRRCVRDDVPVLGLCFGGQALAAALGARVVRAPRGEIGWVTLDDPRGEVSPGPWLAFHFDAFEAPAGAAVLARTDVCAHAFRLGPHLGVQFHPEVTPEIVADWMEGYGDLVAAEGVDPEALVERSRREREGARRRAFALFDGFWHRSGGARS